MSTIESKTERNNSKAEVKPASSLGGLSRPEGKQQSARDEPSRSSESPSGDVNDAKSTNPFAHKLDHNAPVWEAYLKKSNAHDRALAKESGLILESLLLFAALFSAILAAFLLEGCKSLQEDPQEMTNHLLKIVIGRLENSTLPSISTSEVPIEFTPTLSKVVMNVLWFLSLICSLTSAFGAYLAKGSIAFYTSNSTVGMSLQDACSRHCRSMGVARWRLQDIIRGLHILIHFSVYLFLSGLPLFVDNIPVRITVVITSFIGLTAYFMMGWIRCLDPNFPLQSTLSLSTLPKSCISENLMVEVLVSMLVISTDPVDIQMSVEAIAALPRSAEVQDALYKANTAPILIQGLSNQIVALRSHPSPPDDLYYHAAAYLYGISHLLHMRPVSGSANANLRSLVQPGGALAQCSNLEPRIAGLAQSVHDSIILLHDLEVVSDETPTPPLPFPLNPEIAAMPIPSTPEMPAAIPACLASVGETLVHFPDPTAGNSTPSPCPPPTPTQTDGFPSALHPHGEQDYNTPPSTPDFGPKKKSRKKSHVDRQKASPRNASVSVNDSQPSIDSLGAANQIPLSFSHEDLDVPPLALTPDLSHSVPTLRLEIPRVCREDCSPPHFRADGSGRPDVSQDSPPQDSTELESPVTDTPEHHFHHIPAPLTPHSPFDDSVPWSPTSEIRSRDGCASSPTPPTPPDSPVLRGLRRALGGRFHAKVTPDASKYV